MAKKKLTKDELIDRLKEIGSRQGDPESDHSNADSLLLDYINSQEVTDAFEAIEKWYA